MKLINADHLLKNMRAKMKPSTYAAMKMFVDAEEDLNKPVTAVRTFRIWYVWKCGYCDGDLNDNDRTLDLLIEKPHNVNLTSVQKCFVQAFLGIFVFTQKCCMGILCVPFPLL